MQEGLKLLQSFLLDEENIPKFLPIFPIQFISIDIKLWNKEQ